MADKVGALAGATLGFIGNNWAGARKGALFGYEAGKSYQKNMAPVKRKRTQRRKGSTKRRKHEKGERRRKRQTVRGSRALTKRITGTVKRVIACDFNSSLFEKRLGGIINVVTRDNSQIIANDCGNDDQPGNAGQGFIAWSPKQFMDAVSCLYNGKTMNNNFAVNQDNFESKNFKINVQYASKEFTWKNITNNVLHIEVVEATSRRNGDDFFYNSWGQSIGTVNWKGTVPSQITYGMRPQELKNMKSKYSMKSKNIILHPGESFKIFDTWKGCVDFNRYAKENGEIGFFGKGLTKEWCLIIKHEMKVGSNPANTFTFAGRWTANNDKRNALVCDIKSVFKIQQPDETLDINEGNFRYIQNFYENLQQSDAVYDSQFTTKNFLPLNGAA